MKELNENFNIKIYETIDSTQLEAKRICKNKNSNRTVIIAKSQTNGVGTHDRKWFNGGEKNNVAMTLILHPNCNIKEISNITIDIATIITKILEDKYHVVTSIKEPNDIILNCKKLAGILIETTLVGELVECLLIGIGMNVNQMGFPEDLKEIATSLKIETGKEFDVEEIIYDILREIKKISPETV